MEFIEISRIWLYERPPVGPGESLGQTSSHGMSSDVKLFIKDKESCSELCSVDPQCNFSKFYEVQDGKPPNLRAISVRGSSRVHHEQGEQHRHHAFHLQRGGAPVALSEVQDLRLLQIH